MYMDHTKLALGEYARTSEFTVENKNLSNKNAKPVKNN